MNTHSACQLPSPRRVCQRELLSAYDSRAPRYTSYPTAVQFTPAVDASVYGGWLSRLDPERPVSLYAHIPFCARLCWYCGCNTRVVRKHGLIREYVALLEREIALVEAHLPARLTAAALHFGGGTPNMLDAADLARIFTALRRVFDFSEDAEIAAEIDPAQLTDAWVRAAASHGLNRASLGVQDLSPDVQAAVNRHEPFEVLADAAGRLRAAGVDRLNFDLMYGLPRQRVEDVLTTLDAVLSLAPSRIALFGYAHVPWMKAHQKLLDERELPGAEARLDQSQAAAERLVAEGYAPIGMDHFARADDPMAIALAAGRLHRNFQGYTPDDASTLIGFGASAISQTPEGFAQNQTAELAWRHAVAAGRLPTARGVALSDDDRFRGEVIERLMCDLSVDLEAVARRHDRPVDALDDGLDALDAMAADGVLVRDGRRIRITETGRPFVRSACAVFDAHLDRTALRHSRVV